MKDILQGNNKVLEQIDSGSNININKVVRNLLINQNKIIKRIENIQGENLFKGLFR